MAYEEMRFEEFLEILGTPAWAGHVLTRTIDDDDQDCLIHEVAKSSVDGVPKLQHLLDLGEDVNRPTGSLKTTPLHYGASIDTHLVILIS